MLRRLAARGDQVEWFAASFPGAAPQTELDGIRVIRGGRQWSVHWEAYRRYRGQLRGRFDAVIDEVNTMPFFTPLWAGIPSFMLIFQLAREVWWYESRFPINAAGFAIEPLYLRAYRRTPVFTISNSTEVDLRKLGFRDRITVVPIGIEPVQVDPVPRGSTPMLLYVGRLAPSKRVHDLLDALDLLRREFPSARLALVGDGPPAYVERLHRLAARLGIANAVEFCGRLPAAEKHRRMAAADALLMASAREGWGLVITEANACGTPAVVYDVAGLRDAVRNEETGLVVPPAPANLAAAVTRLLKDAGLRDRLGAEARRWSATFSFDRAAEIIREGIAERISP